MKEIIRDLCIQIEKLQQTPSWRWRRLRAQWKRKDEITLYCDCSIRWDGYYGLGVCFVSGGSITLISDGFTDFNRPRHTAIGEMRAVLLALKCAGEYLETLESGTVKRIIVFSDLRIIKRLYSARRSRRFPKFQAVSADIDNIVRRLKTEYHADMDVNYIDSGGQDGNPFFVTAHRASRFAAHPSRLVHGITKKILTAPSMVCCSLLATDEARNAKRAGEA